MSWQLAVAGGVVVGGGLTVVFGGLFPSQRPDPVAVLERLDPAKRALTAQRDTSSSSYKHPLQRIFTKRFLDSVASTTLVRPPHADLALLGVSVEGYVAMRLAAGLIGLVAPPLLAAMAFALGLSLPQGCFCSSAPTRMSAAGLQPRGESSGPSFSDTWSWWLWNGPRMSARFRLWRKPARSDNPGSCSASTTPC